MTSITPLSELQRLKPGLRGFRPGWGIEKSREGIVLHVTV